MAASLSRGWRLWTQVHSPHPAGLNAYPRQLATAAAQQARFTGPPAQAGQEDRSSSSHIGSVEDASSDRPHFKALEGKVSQRTLSSITRNPKMTHMTPVQEAVFKHLPHIARHPETDESGEAVESTGPRDLMVRAKTGTGKTLAFLIPAIEHRLNQLAQAASDKTSFMSGSARGDRRGFSRDNAAHKNVGAIILSPTRELASQIANEAKRIAEPLGFSVHELLGGLPKGGQIRRWRSERRDIVVATTGRLRDLIQSAPDLRESLRTSRMLILDEADTMLDMGFREDIDAISKELSAAPERQTFVFSATISKPIQQVARQVLSKNHVYLNCVSEEDSPVHEHVPQYHTVLTSASEQLSHIIRLISHDQLINPGKSKTIVFLPTTKLTQFVARVLRESKHYMPAGRATSVHELHSKLNMNARVRTSASFRKDSKGASVLVTSDVSARGVDYPGVTRVIQVGIPSSTDQYVHRVGRTGRTGGTQGRGDLVLLPWEQGFLQANLADMPLKPVTTEDLKSSVLEAAAQYDADPKKFFPQQDQKPDFERGDRRGRKFDSAMSSPLTQFERRVEERVRGLDDGRCISKEAYEREGDQYFTEVEEVFSSLLGYYVSRVSDVRSRKDVVLQGLKDWSTQAAGLERAPHVSESFLQRIGFGEGRGASRSRPRSGSSFNYSDRPRSRSFDDRSNSEYNPQQRFKDRSYGWDKSDRDTRGAKRSSPSWMGRGSSGKKFERSRSNSNYSRDDFE